MTMSSPYPLAHLQKVTAGSFALVQDNRGLGAQEGGDTGAVMGNPTQKQGRERAPETAHTTQQASKR